MALLAHRDFGGEGKAPLVILHGLLGSSRNWASAGRDLAAHFHVLALDLRNHGASFHAVAMDYPTMAADVRAWLDAQGLRRVFLMGHSMGGKVAMRLACDSPERVERLVVVDIAPRAYPASHRREFAAMRAFDPARVASRREAEAAMAPLVTDWAMRQFLLTNLERTEGGGFRWIVNLEAIEAALPVLEASPLGAEDRYAGEALFLLGGRSRYFVEGDEAVVAAHFPRARIERIAESGHNPHFETREAFVAAVRRFLPDERP